MDTQERIKQLRVALLGPYEVRRTEKQKSAFISWAKAYGESLGVPVTVEYSVLCFPSCVVVSYNDGKSIYY